MAPKVRSSSISLYFFSNSPHILGGMAHTNFSILKEENLPTAHRASINRTWACLLVWDYVFPALGILGRPALTRRVDSWTMVHKWITSAPKSLAISPLHDSSNWLSSRSPIWLRQAILPLYESSSFQIFIRAPCSKMVFVGLVSCSWICICSTWSRALRMLTDLVLEVKRLNYLVECFGAVTTRRCSSNTTASMCTCSSRGPDVSLAKWERGGPAPRNRSISINMTALDSTWQSIYLGSLSVKVLKYSKNSTI
jgi:hypothetical protein